MKNSTRKNTGLTLLIQRFRAEFETAENINHYSFDNFQKAERKYLKFMLEGEGSYKKGRFI